MANLSFSHGQWVNNDKPGGAVFFVGGGTVAYKGIGASDINDGLTPQQPLSTISAAHTKCVAGRGDTIVVLPGSVTITAAIALTKTDVTLTGFTSVPVGVEGPSEIACATDSVEMIAVDGNNITVENLVLTNTATTSDTFMVDVADTTASAGVVIRNVFFKMTGGAAALNGLRLGDGTTVATNCLVEGCTFSDTDDIAITVSAASDENTLRGNIIYDGVTANASLDAISCAGDGCLIEKNQIRVDGTSGISLVGTLNQLNDNRISVTGANTIGILLADGATAFGNGNVVTAIAAGNLIDATTDADSPTVFADTGNVHAADPALAAFIAPTVGGS